MSSSPGRILDFDLLRRRPILYRWGRVLRNGRLTCSGHNSWSLGFPERVAEKSFMMVVVIGFVGMFCFEGEKGVGAEAKRCARS